MLGRETEQYANAKSKRPRPAFRHHQPERGNVTSSASVQLPCFPVFARGRVLRFSRSFSLELLAQDGCIGPGSLSSRMQNRMQNYAALSAGRHTVWAAPLSPSPRPRSLQCPVTATSGTSVRNVHRHTQARA